MSGKTKEVVSKTTHVSFDDVPGLIQEHARERVEHESLVPEILIDPKSAMQVGCFRVLAGIDAYSIDLNSLLVGKGAKGRRFQFKKVAFDSFDWEEDADFPNVVINAEGPVKYGDGAEHGLSTHLDETDTLEKFGSGTQLRHTTDGLAVLQVRTRLANREDRSGLHAALVRAFAAEPADIRPGRRIVVPEYLDQICRLELLDINEPSAPEDVKQKTWDLVMRLRATIPVVELVQTQPDLRLRQFVDSCVTSAQKP